MVVLLVANHCFTSSSPPSIPRCPIATSSSRIFFFQFPEQNMYWNIAPLRSSRIFLSNESSFAQNWFRTRELCLFYPSAAIYLDEFQNAQRPMFLPYLLVRVFKFIDLGCVRMGISRSFWISNFSSLYISVHVQNLMKTAGLLSNFGDVEEFDFFFDHEFMGTLCHACKTIKCTHYPRGDGRE